MSVTRARAISPKYSDAWQVLRRLNFAARSRGENFTARSRQAPHERERRKPRVAGYSLMKEIIMTLAILTSSLGAIAADLSNGADNFYKSDKVITQKVTFMNQYKMKVVGNLFLPKNLSQNTKNPAIVVGHPMGAVKEQSSN